MLAWAIYKKIFSLFFFCSVLAIFTRQNLIVFVVMGSLFFLYDSMPGRARSARMRETILSVCVLTALVCFSFLVVVTDKEPGAAYHLFAFEFSGVGLKTIAIPFYLLSPFLFVFPFHIKEVITLAIRSWPVTIFAMVTIFQPYSYWLPTGIDNAMRIMAPGIFLLCLPLAVMVGRDFERILPAKWGWVIMGFVPFTYGTSYLFPAGFKPLFLLPKGVMFFVNVLLVAPQIFEGTYRKR
jgi:hypothetical protein